MVVFYMKNKSIVNFERIWQVTYHVKTYHRTCLFYLINSNEMSQICVLSYGKLLIMTWIICSTPMFYHTIQSYSHLEQPDHSMDVITNKYTVQRLHSGVGLILNPGLYPCPLSSCFSIYRFTSHYGQIKLKLFFYD